MKNYRIHFWFIISVILFQLCAKASAIDFSVLVKTEKWKCSYNKSRTKVTHQKISNAMGKLPGLTISGKPTKEKRTFASGICILSEPIDMSGLKTISFFAKSNRTIRPKITLYCKGGSLTSDFVRTSKMNNVFKKFTFVREKLKVNGTPDLTQVQRIQIGMGLWEYDTRKSGFLATFTQFVYEGTENTYIIPSPTRGVAIDGEYKDWGFEDKLYNWTPPDYIYLNSNKQVVSDAPNWRGAGQLSGRFALMMDDTNLYFLALVADAHPGQGANPAHPWKNDSIELFLACKPDRRLLQRKTPLGATDVQIVFDCGAMPGAPKVMIGKKNTSLAVEQKIIPHTWLIGDKQSRGYVLEAAIPLASLPIKKRERGALLAYSIKLNDKSGLSLSATPTNKSPHASIKDYREAYIEVVVKQNEKIRFGALAKERLWPKIYTTGEERIRIWNMKYAPKRLINTTTHRTYLNGLWAVQSVDTGISSPKPSHWNYTPIPMGIGWYGSIFESFKNSPDELGSEQISTRLLDMKKTFFWYERTFTPDPTYRDKHLRLVFESVDKEATVYLNEKILGTVGTGQRYFDISKQIRFDALNRLDVLLYTSINPNMSIRNGTGLNGDVYLEALDHTPVIQDIWVKKASGLDGSFEIVIETGASEPGDQIVAQIIDSKGKSVVQAKATPEKNELNPTVLTGRYDAFSPWSPEHPNLYTLRIRYIRDQKIWEEQKKRFGFRTFRIENARYMLNGKVLRLRTAQSTNGSGVFAPGRLKMLKRFGHNAIFMHASNAGYNDPFFDKLDEEGFIVFAPTDRSWPDSQTVQAIRRYRSHPSICGYVSDAFGQLDANGFIHNPFSTSDSYYPQSKIAINIYNFLRKRSDLFRAIDPTRPYFPHATGNFEGSFRTVNHYPTFDLNMSDRKMYFEPWSHRKVRLHPFNIYECGVSPIPYDLFHPEHTFLVDRGRPVTRLLSYETASRYLGTDAYDNWHDYNTLSMRETVRGLRITGIDGFTPWLTEVFLDPINVTSNGTLKEDKRHLSYRYFQLPYREVFEDQWMRMNSWFYTLRAHARWQWPVQYGQGKLISKSSNLTPIYENEMQPFTAFIAGSKQDVFSKEHNYFSGESIEKQIVIANDTEDDLQITISVMMNVGSEKTKKTLTLLVRQGQSLRHQVLFVAPPVIKKTSGSLELVCTDSLGNQRKDTFNITIFPPEKMLLANVTPWNREDWQQKIGVMAIEGKTLLEKVGVAFTPLTITDAIPSNLDMLVIERQALTDKIHLKSLLAFLENGGRILVLEQTSKGLLDWRLRERRLESVFIADTKHPVLRGLANEDFAYFRGAATIVKSEKRPSKFYRHTQAAAMQTPHLTNVGLVASYVMAKPSYGNFSPLLVGGYDLEESALLEMRSGQGRLLLCQVDVTDRYGVDPAATLLVNNMLTYLLGLPREKPATPVVYIGGKKGRAFLTRLGIKPVPDNTNQHTGREVLVVGEELSESVDVKGYASVIVLPFSTYLPQGIKSESIRLKKMDYPKYNGKSFYQLAQLKSIRPAPDRLGNITSSVFRGLVDNDTYFFDSPQLHNFSENGTSQVIFQWVSAYRTMADIKIGRTRYILCGADPTSMKHGETRRKAWRIWSVLFTNLGVCTSFRPSFTPSVLDMSGDGWTFLTDPVGDGDKMGYPQGRFAGRSPRPIKVGQIWEEQGVTQVNPSIQSPPDSVYDGFGWYFRTVRIPQKLHGKPLYLHVDGIRDIPSHNRTRQQTSVWINGYLMKDPVGIYNGKMGGRGGRLWEVDSQSIHYGSTNFVAIRIYNNPGAGGIHRKPVRFEIVGQNEGMLFPYEFIRSKYNPYYFWCW